MRLLILAVLLGISAVAGFLGGRASRDGEVERAKALVQRCAEQFPTRDKLGSQRPLTR